MLAPFHVARDGASHFCCRRMFRDDAAGDLPIAVDPLDDAACAAPRLANRVGHAAAAYHDSAVGRGFMRLFQDTTLPARNGMQTESSIGKTRVWWVTASEASVTADYCREACARRRVISGNQPKRTVQPSVRLAAPAAALFELTHAVDRLLDPLDRDDLKTVDGLLRRICLRNERARKTELRRFLEPLLAPG